VASFTNTAATYGLPASALTDNGSVYTSRFTHGHNDFERLLASLGITQKNGHPGHPQTQGKIERFHQTLKRATTARATPRPDQGLPTTNQTVNDVPRHMCTMSRDIASVSEGGLEPPQSYLVRRSNVALAAKKHHSSSRQLSAIEASLCPKCVQTACRTPMGRLSHEAARTRRRVRYSWIRD
jgi:transposase InsO family protein